MTTWFIPVLVGWLTWSGHAVPPSPARSPQPTRRAPTLRLGPMLFHVEGGKVKRMEQLDISELFRFAATAFQKKQYTRAIRLYQRIARYFPDHKYAYAAFYNLGLANENSKNYGAAIKAYRTFIKKYPKKSADILHARFRMASCEEALKRWFAAFKMYDSLLQQDLKLDDRMDALAGAGRAMFKLNRYAQALPLLKLTVRLYLRAAKDKAKLKKLDNTAVSIAQYHWARIEDSRFRQRKFRAAQEQMKLDLQYKAKQLLLAQKLYFGTIRFRHVEWSLAALYRIGDMYEKLYGDIVKAPVPKEFKAEDVKLYRKMLRDRIKVLLDKALLAYRRNLMLAQGLGAKDSRWQTATQKRFADLLLFYERTFGKSTSKPASRPTSRPTVPTVAARPQPKVAKKPTTRPTSRPAPR